MSAWSDAVTALSPYLWWKLDETSGTTAADSSGNGLSGTYASATLNQTGLIPGDSGGKSVTLATTAGNISKGSGLSYPSVGVTYAQTYKSSTDFTSGRFFQGSSISTYLAFGSTNMTASVATGQSPTLSYDPSNLCDGNPHFIVYVVRTTTVELWVDGTQVATGSHAASSATLTAFQVKQSSSNPTGSFDDVLIFASALSSTQIGDLTTAWAGTVAPANATLSATLRPKTASFAVATVLAASLIATLQPKTAAITLNAVGAPDRTVSLSAEVPRKVGSFGLLAGADVSLAATLRPKTSAFTVLGAASATLAATLQPKTAAFALETSKTLTLSATLRRRTSSIAIASNPAVRLAATLRPKVAAIDIQTQPTVTFAATLAPRVAIFTVRTETGVTPAPLPAAGMSMVVGKAFGPITMQGSQPHYTVSRAETARARQRILVDGIDVTYFRNCVTPPVAYTLLEPLLYGPATMEVPGVAACYERLGVGALSWLRPGAPVEVQRVLDDVVVGTDWKGFIVAFDESGRNLSVELGGQANGRAALRDRQVPIFSRVNDLGHQVTDAVRDLGLPALPYIGPVTGIEMMTTGGESHLDHINSLIAKAWTRAGRQWTVMPDESTGVYEMHRKDDTTIHGTVFLDDAQTVANLRRDMAEEPNRIYGTGVAPNGMRVRNGVYPGLIQGRAPDFPGHMELGDSGEGVRLLIGRLQAVGYLKLADAPGGFDADVVEAVKELQNGADLFQTGEVNEATWRALYDLDVTGGSLEWAHVEPMAQRSKVRPWRRSGSGSIMGINPSHEPDEIVVDRSIDFGAGIKGNQQQESSKAILHDSDDPNWLGTITFRLGALLYGEVAEGATITETDVMDARELRPGMNLWLPQFDGGTLVHVAACEVDSDGIATATVDTRFRDAMEVWEVMARNRESRNDPTRSRARKHRSSTIAKDSIGEWDEIGGLLGNDVALDPGWNIIKVIGAYKGTIARLDLLVQTVTTEGETVTITPHEFACAVFGRNPGRNHLNDLIPAPLTTAGTKMWQSKRAALEAQWILYSAGTKDEPCGYGAGLKTDGDDLTGQHVNDAGFAYRSDERTWLYVAVWVAEETTLHAGRIMWPQLEAGV